MIAGYEIVKKLVEGERSVVYLARPETRPDYVLVQVMRPDVAADSSAVLRFLMDAEAARALAHPNVARWVSDGTLDDGRPWLLSEPVAENVATFLDVRGGQPLPEVLPLVWQVCDALEYLHAQGVVHGSVSPAMVFLSPTEVPQAKLVELSLASSKLDGSVSPAYVPPEVLRGQPVSVAADIYGTGLLLYEMVTGTPAFEGEDEERVRRRQVEEAPRLPADQLGAVAPVLKRCLLKFPEQRYESAAALRAALLGKRDAAQPAPRGAARDVVAQAPVAPQAAVPDLLELEREFIDEPITRTQSTLVARLEPALASAPVPADSSARPSAGRGRTLVAIGGGVALVVGVVAAAVLAMPGEPEGADLPAVAAAPAAEPAPTPAPPPAPTPTSIPTPTPTPEEPPTAPTPADPGPATVAMPDPAPRPADPAPNEPEPPAAEPEKPEKPARVDVLVTSSPSGAEVERFDTHARIGRTPLTVSVLRDAELELSVALEGYVPSLVKLTVDSPSPTQVSLEPFRVAKPKPKPPPSPRPKRPAKVDRDVQLDPFGN